MERTAFLKFTGHAARYGVVGVIGTILHIGTLVLLVEKFQADPVLSSVAGFILALIVSYFLNFSWVFDSSRQHQVAGFRYVVVSVSGLALSTLIMYTAVDLLHWWYGWGVVCLVLVVPISNFLLNYLWTFGAHEASSG